MQNRGFSIPRRLFNVSSACEKWTDECLDFSVMENIGKYVLDAHGVKSDNVEISVLLTNSNEMHELNKKYRGVNRPTNVLSFEGDDPNSSGTLFPCFLGSIALGYEVVAKEAIEQGKTFKNHFLHLIVHALLHLLGYDHEKSEIDRIKMENTEIDTLKQFNINDPYE